METREIDTRLQRYTAAEHRIGANLQELEQHSVYQLLMTDELQGATARALSKVTSANPTLWDLFGFLSTALETARRVRGTGRLNSQERSELTKLLGTDSVLVRTESIPLGERDLTSGSTREEYVSIDTLIDRMSKLYEPVRDVVTHAEQILRNVLPRLNSAETTVSRLRAEATSLGLDAADLDRIDQTIARVRELSLTDPLSIPPNARESFDDAIHDATSRIATAKSSHDALAKDIAGAADLLDRCRELITRAKRSRDEALTKIAQPTGLRQPPSMQAIDGPNGLSSRLDPILASNKPWQGIRRDLDAWASAATRLSSQLTRVAEANARPLEQRDELRGRLSAFRAKMAATGYSEDFVLRDLSAEAHNELFTSPTDLARAEKLVSEFGDRLANS